MVINSTSARGDIFKEFYSVIKNTFPGIKVTNAFVEDIAQIPQIVVNVPTLPRNRQEFGTVNYNRDGIIEIEIYHNSVKDLTILLDQLEATILTSTAISVQNIRIGDSTIASFDLLGKRVHVIVLPIGFMFRR